MTILISKCALTLLCLLVAYIIGKALAKNHQFSYLDARHNRLGAIDGLRGYLAIFVFFHHVVVTYYWKRDGYWGYPPEPV
jgi:uncharacterized membrane protein